MSINPIHSGREIPFITQIRTYAKSHRKESLLFFLIFGAGSICLLPRLPLKAMATRFSRFFPPSPINSLKQQAVLLEQTLNSQNPEALQKFLDTTINVLKNKSHAQIQLKAYYLLEAKREPAAPLAEFILKPVTEPLLKQFHQILSYLSQKNLEPNTTEELLNEFMRKFKEYQIKHDLLTDNHELLNSLQPVIFSLINTSSLDIWESGIQAAIPQLLIFKMLESSLFKNKEVFSKSKEITDTLPVRVTLLELQTSFDNLSRDQKESFVKDLLSESRELEKSEEIFKQIGAWGTNLSRTQLFNQLVTQVIFFYQKSEVVN